MLNKSVGDAVEVSVLRDGKNIIIEAIPTEDPKSDKEFMQIKSSGKSSNRGEEELPDDHQFGLSVAELSGHYRSRLSVEDDIEGVVVEGVKRGSAAYFSGIRPGMVIMSLNKISTTNSEEFASACNASKSDEKNATLLLVYFDGITQFVVMREK